MAFSLIPAGVLGSAAYTLDAADGSNGNKYVNNGRDRLVVVNGDPAQEITLTFNVPTSTDTSRAEGNVIADRVITITAVPFWILEPFSKEFWDQKESDGESDDVGAVTFMPAGTLTNVSFAVVAFAPSGGA